MRDLTRADATQRFCRRKVEYNTSAICNTSLPEVNSLPWFALYKASAAAWVTPRDSQNSILKAVEKMAWSRHRRMTFTSAPESGFQSGPQRSTKLGAQRCKSHCCPSQGRTCPREKGKRRNLAVSAGHQRVWGLRVWGPRKGKALILRCGRRASFFSQAAGANNPKKCPEPIFELSALHIDSALECYRLCNSGNRRTTVQSCRHMHASPVSLAGSIFTAASASLGTGRPGCCPTLSHPTFMLVASFCNRHGFRMRSGSCRSAGLNRPLPAGTRRHHRFDS